MDSSPLRSDLPTYPQAPYDYYDDYAAHLGAAYFGGQFSFLPNQLCRHQL